MAPISRVVIDKQPGVGTPGKNSCPEAEWRFGHLHGSGKGQIFVAGEGREDILGPYCRAD